MEPYERLASRNTRAGRSWVSLVADPDVGGSSLLTDHADVWNAQVVKHYDKLSRQASQTWD